MKLSNLVSFDTRENLTWKLLELIRVYVVPDGSSLRYWLKKDILSLVQRHPLSVNDVIGVSKGKINET